MLDYERLWPKLIDIVSQHGADVDREFFDNCAQGFHGSEQDFIDFVRKNAAHWYQSLGHSPRWIQEAEWPFSDGRPMIFVGQLDIKGPSTYFHDDASFFLFWNPQNGETKTVIQVA